MPETNPRLWRTFRSKMEQKGIIEGGQGSGKVSCKETCPLWEHREEGCGKAWLEGSTRERESRAEEHGGSQVPTGEPQTYLPGSGELPGVEAANMAGKTEQGEEKAEGSGRRARTHAG